MNKKKWIVLAVLLAFLSQPAAALADPLSGVLKK